MNDTTTIKGIENGRAKFAYECAIDGSKIPKKAEYESYVKKIPMLIKTNGLAATLGFMLSKGETYLKIGDQILEWLNKDNKKIIDLSTVKNFEDLVYISTQLNSTEYRLLTNELLAFFTWLKRFASGLIKKD